MNLGNSRPLSGKPSRPTPRTQKLERHENASRLQKAHNNLHFDDDLSNTNSHSLDSTRRLEVGAAGSTELSLKEKVEVSGFLFCFENNYFF